MKWYVIKHDVDVPGIRIIFSSKENTEAVKAMIADAKDFIKITDAEAEEILTEDVDVFDDNGNLINKYGANYENEIRWYVEDSEW